MHLLQPLCRAAAAAAQRAGRARRQPAGGDAHRRRTAGGVGAALPEPAATRPPGHRHQGARRTAAGLACRWRRFRDAHASLPSRAARAVLPVCPCAPVLRCSVASVAAQVAALQSVMELPEQEASAQLIIERCVACGMESRLRCTRLQPGTAPRLARAATRADASGRCHAARPALLLTRARCLAAGPASPATPPSWRAQSMLWRRSCLAWQSCSALTCSARHAWRSRSQRWQPPAARSWRSTWRCSAR